MKTPKEQFLSIRKDDAEQLRHLMVEPWFMTALTYARAQYAFNPRTVDELSGANAFADTLCSLAESTEPIDSLPSNELTSPSLA